MKKEKKRVTTLLISALGLIVLVFVIVTALRHSSDSVVDSGSAIELEQEIDLKDIEQSITYTDDGRIIIESGDIIISN